MLVIDFIKQKNAILFKLTGITLVPEAQIQEVEQRPMNFKSDTGICPYCILYWETMCKGCTMDTAFNNCEQDNSSYLSVRDKINYSMLSHVPELIDLVNQYNKELEDANSN